jgi:hypothetical protein
VAVQRLPSGPQVYTLQVRASLGGTFGDVAAYQWQHLLCESNQYSVLLRDSVTCVACPAGGDCTPRPKEGVSVVTLSDVISRKGYWASQSSDGTSYYQCPLATACLPGANGTRSVCATGYGHVACSVCVDGFFMQFGKCEPCPATPTASVGAIVAAIAGAAVLGGLVFLVRRLVPVETIKLGVSMVQIIAAANSAYRCVSVRLVSGFVSEGVCRRRMSAGLYRLRVFVWSAVLCCAVLCCSVPCCRVSYLIAARALRMCSIPWPPAFSQFLNSLRIFLVDAISVTRANCAQPMTFFASMTVMLVTLKAVLVLIVLGGVAYNLISDCRSRPRAPPQRKRDGAGGAASSGGASGTAGSSTGAVVSTAAGASECDDDDDSDSNSDADAAQHKQQADPRDFHRRWGGVINACFMVALLAYPGVSLKVLSIFVCRDVEGVSWLAADMRLRCYTAQWAAFAAYAFAMIVVYVVGLPATAFFVLWRRRHVLYGPASDGVQRTFGFLYVVYGPTAWM